MKTQYRRNNLPHIHPIGAAFSVTTIVHDAVPAGKIAKLKEERDRQIAILQSQQIPVVAQEIAQVSMRFEQDLELLLAEKREQEHPFRDAGAALAVLRRVGLYHGELYHCHAACVMSNHLHLLLDLSVQLPEGWAFGEEIPDYHSLAEVMRKIKGGSANVVNRLVGRKGPLWEKGYYDRFIRSVRHFRQAYGYILNNPVKAGVVRDWRDYPYIFCPSEGK